MKITWTTHTAGLSLRADLGMFGGNRLRSIDVPVSQRNAVATCWQPRLVERTADIATAVKPAYVVPTSVPLSRRRARSLT